ncbi:BV-E31 [Buzura suppressaria nucleopolyhedrovirus]|uniref:ADPRase n=1 Tax=Buzura suppressaria nuclear polyhedrosis virus TaxID=74320 RepID=W5VKD1_NPVBS|nr:BV-E31 [Buzura suppressaria nucleopolyhedrovirus]AHH82616.1 BV-E31 [Buzura suppressaria nucleopolyhedrovirus]AKN90997.1 ADPRase [Buzura suppressaria nucleopolyhedrovirus]QYF10540.1 bv-e31 [Buzura suppressaria nucleopolyhedrovirus]
MRCAGLFMIIEPDKAVLLCARRSYDNPAQYHNSDALQRANFLEKISIPRGKRDGQDIFDYETAVREYIEETGTFFESAIIHKVPFVLQWNDNGVTYKYVIYVGILRGILKNVSREPNTYCVKLQTLKNNEYSINIESRIINNEIPRNLYIVKLDYYFKYMSEKQLTTYQSSNYLEFFTFVNIVKNKFNDGRVEDFFLITLKLDTLETNNSARWKCRRSKIVLATRRELMNIMNTV